MLKKQSASHFLPLILIAGGAAGLVACSGNSSSTTIGPPPIIDAITVDKTIAAVEWSPNNEVEMASHAYRAIARHSMLATLYSGRSAVFSSFITIIQGTRDRNCNSSGSMDAVDLEAVCQDANDVDVSCTITENDKQVSNPDAFVKTTEQSAIFYRCQDGTTSGSYFDGPLRVMVKNDFSVDDVYTATTTVSAEALVSQQGENGKFVLDSNDQVVKVQTTDFLMQNELNTFFMSYEYNLAIEYDTSSNRLTTRVISECTTEDETVDSVLIPGTSIVTQEVLSTDFVAGLQEPNPQFPYTEFTDLDLIATNNNFRCEDIDEDAGNGNEALRYDTTYSLSTKIESKALGEDTQFDWTDLVIPTDQKKIGGIMTLTHINQSPIVANYVVSVVFDEVGNVTVNNGPQMTVQEFLDKSELVEID
jgi:hypothetical protein